jgi:hypothetical protein
MRLITPRTSPSLKPYYVVTPYEDAVPPLRFERTPASPTFPGQDPLPGGGRVLAWRRYDDPRVTRWPAVAVSDPTFLRPDWPWLRLYVDREGGNLIVTRHASPGPRTAKEAVQMQQYVANLDAFLAHRAWMCRQQCPTVAVDFEVCERAVAVSCGSHGPNLFVMDECSMFKPGMVFRSPSFTQHNAYVKKLRARIRELEGLRRDDTQFLGEKQHRIEELAALLAASKAGREEEVARLERAIAELRGQFGGAVTSARLNEEIGCRQYWEQRAQRAEAEEKRLRFKDSAEVDNKRVQIQQMMQAIDTLRSRLASIVRSL